MIPAFTTLWDIHWYQNPPIGLSDIQRLPGKIRNEVIIVCLTACGKMLEL